MDLLDRNRLSLIALGVSVLYIVIASTSRVVLLGIFPILLSLRAWRRHETLAPLAMVSAIGAFVIAIEVLSRH